MVINWPAALRVLEKSPASSCGLGSVPTKVMPWTKRTFSMLMKKKVRFVPL